MDVFDIPAIEVDSCLFFDSCSLLKNQTALFLLNLDICQRHLFVHLFNAILDIEYFSLTFLLLL